MGFSEIFTALEELFESYDSNHVQNLDEGRMVMNPCKVCNKTDGDKPMCFRGAEWCSESHRKIVLGDQPVKRY